MTVLLIILGVILALVVVATVRDRRAWNADARRRRRFIEDHDGTTARLTREAAYEIAARRFLDRRRR